MPPKKLKTKTKLLTFQEIKDERITRRMKKMLEANEKRNKFKMEKCAICITQLQENSASLPCSHVYCFPCIAIWAKTNESCPFCRIPFEYVHSTNGKKYTRMTLIEKWGKTQFEQKLRCEACWADIQDNESILICFNCRSVYLHIGCASENKQLSSRWYCEECMNEEEQQLNKEEEEKIKKMELYHCPIKRNQK